MGTGVPAMFVTPEFLLGLLHCLCAHHDAASQ